MTVVRLKDIDMKSIAVGDNLILLGLVKEAVLRDYYGKKQLNVKAFDRGAEIFASKKENVSEEDISALLPGKIAMLWVTKMQGSDGVSEYISLTGYKVLQDSVTDVLSFQEVTVDVESLWLEFIRLKSLISADYIGVRILDALIKDHSDIMRYAPGGVFEHHSYLGGWLEHTVNVAKVAYSSAAVYTDIDLDLLLSSCLLHDIGKLLELKWNYKTNRSFRDAEYAKTGHVIVGADMIQKLLSGLKYKRTDAVTEIRHCVLSHHSHYKQEGLPQTLSPEAILLKMADQTDASINSLMKNGKEL